MKKFKNQLLKAIIQQSPHSCKWADKINQLTSLNRLIKSYLPPELGAHCQVANIRDNAIILTTTNPSWNHQLRFQANELLGKIRKNPKWAGITRIDCKTIPIEHPTQPKSTLKPLSLSPEGADHILATAKLCTSKSLQTALYKLAEKGFNNKSKKKR